MGEVIKGNFGQREAESAARQASKNRHPAFNNGMYAELLRQARMIRHEPLSTDIDEPDPSLLFADSTRRQLDQRADGEFAALERQDRQEQEDIINDGFNAVRSMSLYVVPSQEQ